jgi:glycosyltransferase involved in cell wall biosynthesis
MTGAGSKEGLPAETRPPSVLFIVRSLDRGGAERQLTYLARGLHKRGWPVSVACFYVGGAIQREIEGAGIDVIDLKKGGRWDLFAFLLRLRKLLREARPEIIHSYLTGPNIVAALSRIVAGNSKIVWGVRVSHMNFDYYDRFSRMIAAMESRLSRLAHLVIANSVAGRAHCVASGYPARKMRVVANGFDPGTLKPDRDGAAHFKRRMRIPQDKTLVGIIARLDPMKGHETFLHAARLVLESGADLHFVCVGSGLGDYAQSIRQLSRSLGLEKDVSWVDEQDAMAPVYSALDLVVSASSGEGFSNVIAEAMLCECPCVVTDVGDSAAIVGELGEVVAPDRADEMAPAILRLLARTRNEAPELQRSVRRRIVEQFSVDRLVDTTSSIMREVAGR